MSPSPTPLQKPKYPMSQPSGANTQETDAAQASNPDLRSTLPMSQSTLLYLQRTIGNHAVNELLKNSASAPRKSPTPQHQEQISRDMTTPQKDKTPLSDLPSPAIMPANERVQRNVGFEFELEDSVKTFQKKLISGYKPLSKRARILNGVDFYIEADGLPLGQTSWEFVTTAFPETGNGMTRLMTALSAIDGIVGALRAGPMTVPNNPTNFNAVGAAFTAFGAPVGNRYFTISSANFRTKPQVTAGFALAALDELFNSSSGGGGASNLVHDTNSMDASGQVLVPAPDVPLGNMRNAADQEIVNVLGGVADPALRGLVTQLMQIIIGGQNNIGATPKTIMRLVLGRSDMATAFNQLPPLIHAQFQAAPGTFATLVLDAVGRYNNAAAPAGGGAVITGNLFADHQYLNDPRYNMPSPFLQVTRTLWLTNIAGGGQDMLSQGHYPVRTNAIGMKNKTDKEANRLLSSMGALHAALDPGNRPVFEIRSSKSLYASLIRPYALDFFKYVRYLHNPGALTESDELTGMAAQDIIDIVGFAPNRTALLNAMDFRAIQNFNS